jgi:hypothetical protein
MSNYEFRLGAQLVSFLRRSPVREIKRRLRLAQQHDLPISAVELETHHLAGGRIGDLVDALIYAREHGMILSLTRAAAQDLARGRQRLGSGLSPKGNSEFEYHRLFVRLLPMIWNKTPAGGVSALLFQYEKS